MNVYYAPGAKLSPDIVEKLKAANKDRKANDFAWYVRQLANIFDLRSNPKCDLSHSITEKEKTFFSGFVIGEGSINVSVKKSKSSRFGIVLDPEFSVTQHVNGVSYLFLPLCIFRTGTFYYKTSSLATMEYRLDNRESLEKKVIPFYEQYCKPHWSKDFQKRVEMFKTLFSLFHAKAHSNIDSFCDEMLPLCFKLRKQENQKNALFTSLDEAQAYAREYETNKENNKENKNKGSSETTRDSL